MEEMQQSNPEFNEVPQETAPSHSDNIVGLFMEPAPTFEKMSYFPAKTTDWLIPTLLIIVIAIFANFVMFSNAQIKYSMIEKQMEKITQNFNEMVEKGQMPPEVAEEQLEKIRENMDKNLGGFSPMQIIGTFIVIFLKLFIVAGVFFLFFKLIYKGDGNYKNSLVALGLPTYISVIQVVVMVLAALLMKKVFSGLSVSDFLDIDKGTYKGYLLSYIDPFTIWFYAVVSVGYGKLFKVNAVKSYSTVFGLWIGFTILLFVLAQYVPFLKFFGIGA